MKTLLSILAILLLMLYVIPNSMAWDWEEELMADGLERTTITSHGAIG